jgi:CRISPR/Cas system-associated exonuclease Cas4 (RecB family)
LSFKLNYFDKIQGEGNGFADYGTFAHSILEMFSKKIVTAEECVGLYQMGFDDAVVNPYPPYPVNMREINYKRGLDYFQNFNGFQGFETISTEQNLTAKIGPHNFRGIIDLVLKATENGKVVIVDHKTKSPSSMKKEFQLYKKQLYLYALLYFTKYGTYPDSMAFNMIATGEMLEVPFLLSEYEDTIKWAHELIEEIIMTTEFPGKIDKYFCNNICGMRSICPHLLQEITKNMDDEEAIAGWDFGR